MLSLNLWILKSTIFFNCMGYSYFETTKKLSIYFPYKLYTNPTNFWKSKPQGSLFYCSLPSFSSIKPQCLLLKLSSWQLCYICKSILFQRNFQGSCILFAQLVWDGATIWPYSEPCCDFLLYMNLGCTLLYAFLMGIYSLCISVPRRFPFARRHAKELK